MTFRLRVDPEQWTVDMVKHWMRWAVGEFSLEGVNINNFNLTGPELCNLKHQEYVKYIPCDKGDTFWTHLELLRKCKFVGEYLLSLKNKDHRT